MIRAGAAIAACFAACTAQCATVEAVLSPTSIVVRGEDGLYMQTLSGRPVLYCGLDPFVSWASARLVGKALLSGRDAGPLVSVDGETVPLRTLLARDGWLRPTVLDEHAQAAIAERRGGWSCAPRSAPFEEMASRVDPKVLTGIALNESAFRGRPWPWTLNVAGRGFFFATRDDAYAAIGQLLRAGRCDFDVGLMQINWCYHKERFASAWDALSPMTSIRVAEKLLVENLQRSGSPVKAVAWYHSADPSRGMPYFNRFMTHLSQLDRK